MAEHSSDLALVGAVVRREPGAFARFESKTDRVIAACLSKALAKWPAAHVEREDLAQSFGMFLVEDNFRVLQTYSGRAALTTWIHSVAIRFFYRRTRRLAQRRLTLLDQEALATVRDSGVGPEEQVVVNAQITSVRSALESCTADERAMLRLLYEQEMPAHAVGRILGLSGAGVRMKKKRLLARLADHLEGLWK